MAAVNHALAMGIVSNRETAGTIRGYAAEMHRVRYPNAPIPRHRIGLFHAFMNHTILDRSDPPAPIKNSPRFLLFVICLFASAGQLAIDIYVPALPAMARFFATSPQAIQSSVSGYMAAYAFGQLVFGPVSDAYGRKPVLAFGLVIFTIGCLLSLAAPNLETFLLARCLQGFGIAATNLLAKAIITDSFSGQALMHAFTYMAIAWGLAPIVAPVIGAHLQTWFGWQACLVFLLIYSLVMWAVIWRYRETLLRPVRLEPRTLMTNAGKVLRARCSRAASSLKACATASCSSSTSSGRSWCRTRCTSRRPISATSRSVSG